MVYPVRRSVHFPMPPDSGFSNHGIAADAGAQSCPQQLIENSPRNKMWGLLLVCLILWILGLVIYSEGNDFPYFYHTDEPSKAEQLVTGNRNFFHPALMLNATDLLSRALGIPRTEQDMVVVGRHVSACFASLTLLGFALVTRQLAGNGAGVIAWVSCLLLGDFYDAAHYMKEDPYWLSGLAFTVLAGLRYTANPSRRLAILVGLAAGWSVAGKYIGILAVFIALICVLTTHRSTVTQRGSNLLSMLLCVCGVFLCVNYQMLSNPMGLWAGLDKEVDALHSEYHQRKADEKSLRYLEILEETVPPIAQGLYLGLLVLAVRRWKSVSAPEKILVFLPLILFLVLSLTPKGSVRYFLPIGLMMMTSAAVACARLAYFPKFGKFQSIALTLGFLCLIVPMVNAAKKHRKDMLKDHRRQLGMFLTSSIQPNAVVLSSYHAGILNSQDERCIGFANLAPQTFVMAQNAYEKGTLDDLLAQGVTHVVVTGRDFTRSLDNLGNPQVQKMTEQRRKQLQKELESQGTVLWHIKKGGNKYLNPALTLYQLPTKPALAPSGGQP